MTGRAASLVVVLTALVASGPALPAEDASAFRDPFPAYPGLEGQVDFWVRVFSEWDLDQIAVHDMDYPAIVYEVVPLAGRREFPYTEEQQEFVDDLREKWEKRLEKLERRIAKGRKLSADDKALALMIAGEGGTDAIEGIHERVRTQRGLRERFGRGLEISGRYIDDFREIFRNEGLPEDLAFLPHVESSFQTDAHSSAGAVGIWQFTRGTGRQYLMISSAYDERRDPVASTRGAARYFRDAYDLLGDWALAITSYNHGLQGMSRAKEEFGVDFERIQREYSSRVFGFASKNFYAEFLAARRIARDPSAYFPEGLSAEPPLRLDRIVLKRRRSPGSIAGEYGVPLDELAALNTGWSQQTVSRGYPLPVGATVWLPEGSVARAARARNDGIHVVQRDDTLSTIAQRYGLTVAELRALNEIAEGESLIRVGQELKVGTAVPLVETIHVVRRGESLSTIARRFGMTVGELRRLNGIAPGDDVIRVGQRLRVEMSGEPETVVHVVERGDSLIRIATYYGVRLSSLLGANGLTMQSIIYPGQKILIPLTD